MPKGLIQSYLFSSGTWTFVLSSGFELYSKNQTCDFLVSSRLTVGLHYLQPTSAACSSLLPDQSPLAIAELTTLGLVPITVAMPETPLSGEIKIHRSQT